MDESRDDRVEIDAGRWDAVQWTSINDGEAEEMWGSGVPRLADVAVAGYAIGEWNGRAVLRVRQIVSGTAVDLMFERTDGFASRAVKAGGAATDPVARPAAPDARTLVTISEARDGYRVTVRAPLAADSLKVLLGKVREEGTP